MKHVILFVLLLYPIVSDSSIYQGDVSCIIEQIEKERDKRELEAFLFNLALKESMNQWTIINRFGYVGKYQFGTPARKDVGAPTFTVKEFRNNPCIWPEEQQDQAVIQYIKQNHRILSNFFKKNGYPIGETIQLAIPTKWYDEGECVTVTWAGLYAACHLVGAGNVRKFLKTNGLKNKSDGNGITTFDYMKHFSNPNMVSILNIEV